MATATSVIIPGCRAFSSSPKPFRKGQPPYQKTAEENPNNT